MFADGKCFLICVNPSHKIYTVCHFFLNFRLKFLFASVDKCKFNDGNSPFQNFRDNVINSVGILFGSGGLNVTRLFDKHFFFVMCFFLPKAIFLRDKMSHEEN